MKRFILTMGTGVLAAAMATPSFAADLARSAYKSPAVPYIAPFSWSGFYLGINGGYGFGSSEWSGPVSSDTFEVNGWLVGATVGYNLQTGNWVWGLEGDIDASRIKGSDNNPGGGGVCGGAAGCETKNSWFATARGRIGYAWNRWLPYITGGGAFADVKMTPNLGTSETETRVGWTLGAGMEWAFTAAWSAKIEYLYADLGTATCDAVNCGIDTDVDFKTNIVRVGVNYRF